MTQVSSYLLTSIMFEIKQLIVLDSMQVDGAGCLHQLGKNPDKGRPFS